MPIPNGCNTIRTFVLSPASSVTTPMLSVVTWHCIGLSLSPALLLCSALYAQDVIASA